MHDLVITKSAFHKVLSPIARFYADVSAIVRSNLD
jgi:hypothetical protein